jgi:hypothetical protein
MPAGAPTKYKPEHCDKVIALGMEGYNKTEMAVALDIHKDTLYEWIKVHPEFSDAIKRAEQAAEHWYQRTFRSMAVGGIDKGNATALIFAAKNQLPDVYRDRREHHVDGELGLFQIDYLGYQGEDAQDSQATE